jgi:tetratricopeptide (TPR) repeat protein
VLLRLARGVPREVEVESILPLCASLEKILEKSAGAGGAWSSLALLRAALPGDEARDAACEAALRGLEAAAAAGEPTAAQRRVLREILARRGGEAPCRLKLLSRLPPPGAADDLAAGLASAEEARRCLEAVAHAGSDGEPADAAARRRYLEALLLERLGRLEEALERLRPLAGGDEARSEAIAACVRLLRRSGRAAEAGALLSAALAKSPRQGPDLWELWLETELAARSPAAVLADLPEPPSNPEPAAAGPAPARSGREDARWLLAALAAGKGIRIRCGGGALEGPDGTVWGEDRFSLGGEPAQVTGVAVRGAELPELYRRCRQFSEWLDEDLCGYRLPLPAGSYRVRLHFAEVDRNVPGSRRFDVVVADQGLTDLDVCREAGFRAALVKTFEVKLDGAPLEIRFQSRLGDAMVSGIEIARIE